MKALVAECLGTGMLCLLGIGVVANVVLSRTKRHGSGWIVICSGWSMAVFVAVACAADFSGAHLNPAVTVGLAIAGLFKWSLVPTYIIALCLGAMLGATLAWLAYRPHFAETDDPTLKLAVFATGPAIDSSKDNFIAEVIGTFVLVITVLYFANPAVYLESGQDVRFGLGALGALPAVFVVFAIGLCLGGPTGYAINPARDLGPRIMHACLPIAGKGDSQWSYGWIPIAGPIVGATLAALLFRFLGYAL